MSGDWKNFEGAEVAELYGNLMIDYSDELIQNILEYLNESQVGRKSMVDVGCGGGGTTLRFASAFENVLGIDSSHAQVEIARRRTSENTNARFETVHDNQIPVASSSVDMVLCATALHYLDAPTFLRECDRVLRRKGALVVIIYGPNILKSLNGETISDFAQQDSQWRKAMYEYNTNCGVGKTVVDTYDDRYCTIFESIRNPNKRRLDGGSYDRKFTIAGLLRFFSTIGGYMTQKYPDPKLDPLNIMRGRLEEMMKAIGSECEDHTELFVTMQFSAMVVQKTEKYGIF